MKKVILPLLLLFAAVFHANGQAKTVDSVFNKYYAATGGTSLWNGVNSYTLSQQYRSGSASDYDADIRVSLAEKAMYKNRIIQKRGFIFGFNASDSWYKVPLGSGNQTTNYQVNKLSSAEESNMKIEMYELLVPFLDYKKRNFVATLVGQEKLGTKTVDRVELQGNNVRYNLYFDPSTGLLLQSKKLEAGVETVFDFSNYKKSAYGISYPGTTIISGKKIPKNITVTSALTVNEAIPATYFRR